MSSIRTCTLLDGSLRFEVRYLVAPGRRRRAKTFQTRDAANKFAASVEPPKTPPLLPTPEPEDDGEWRTDAACRGVTSREDDVFFGVDNLGEQGHPGLSTARHEEITIALTFCQSCPVTRQCLRMAMRAEAGAPATRSRYGIFGGRTPRQRDRIAAARRRKAS